MQHSANAVMFPAAASWHVCLAANKLMVQHVREDDQVAKNGILRLPATHLWHSFSNSATPSACRTAVMPARPPALHTSDRHSSTPCLTGVSAAAQGACSTCSSTGTAPSSTTAAAIPASACSNLRMRCSAGSALLQLLPLPATGLPVAVAAVRLGLLRPVLLVSTAAVLSHAELPAAALLLVAAVKLSSSTEMPPHSMKLALQRGATCGIHLQPRPTC